MFQAWASSYALCFLLSSCALFGGSTLNLILLPSKPLHHACLPSSLCFWVFKLWINYFLTAHLSLFSAFGSDKITKPQQRYFSSHTAWNLSWTASLGGVARTSSTVTSSGCKKIQDLSWWVQGNQKLHIKVQLEDAAVCWRGCVTCSTLHML